MWKIVVILSVLKKRPKSFQHFLCHYELFGCWRAVTEYKQASQSARTAGTAEKTLLFCCVQLVVTGNVSFLLQRQPASRLIKLMSMPNDLLIWNVMKLLRLSGGGRNISPPQRPRLQRFDYTHARVHPRYHPLLFRCLTWSPAHGWLWILEVCQKRAASVKEKKKEAALFNTWTISQVASHLPLQRPM